MIFLIPAQIPLDIKNSKTYRKRIVTFNPKLAAKQKYEINRQVEKAKKLKASQAKDPNMAIVLNMFLLFPLIKGRRNRGCCKSWNKRKAIENARRFAGYNMIVTSEIHMAASKVYAAYHNLWRIEESFRVMKSQLDARPVYLQNRKRSPDISSFVTLRYCWPGSYRYTS